MFCKVEKCTNKVLAKGLCSKHYTTLRRYGTLEKPIKLIEYCKVEGCHSKVLAKAYCSRHYNQTSKYGGIKKITRKDPNFFETSNLNPQEAYIIICGKNDIVTKILIDYKNLLTVRRYKWYVGKNGYVVSDSHKKSQYLHRLVLGNPEENVDHINRNVLDNRECNLRVCTQSQNGFNRKLNKNNTTGFKGVTKKRNKYVAQIKINYNTIRLGSFDTAEEAAIEYNKAAKKYGGRFATLNVVED